MIFAVNRWERYTELRLAAERQELSEELEQLVGGVKASISVNPGETSVVGNTAFGDSDLRELLKFADRLAKADAPITHLQLIGTKVTDRGVAAIANLESLEICELHGSKITDKAVDHLQKIRKLRVLSVEQTAVTDGRLKQLSIDRPDLDIEPKTYQKVLP